MSGVYQTKRKKDSFSKKNRGNDLWSTRPGTNEVARQKTKKGVQLYNALNFAKEIRQIKPDCGLERKDRGKPGTICFNDLWVSGNRGGQNKLSFSNKGGVLTKRGKRVTKKYWQSLAQKK